MVIGLYSEQKWLPAFLSFPLRNLVFFRSLKNVILRYNIRLNVIFISHTFFAKIGAAAENNSHFWLQLGY